MGLLEEAKSKQRKGWFIVCRSVFKKKMIAAYEEHGRFDTK